MERRKSLSVAHKSSPVRSRLHVQLVKSVPPYDYEMLLSQFNWWAWEEQQRAHFSWNNLTKESPELTIYLEDSQWVVWAKFQKKTLSEHLSKQDWDLLQNQMEHLLTMIVQHHLPFSLEGRMKQNKPWSLQYQRLFLQETTLMLCSICCMARDRSADDSMQKGVISASNSPWDRPVVIVRRKDGTCTLVLCRI